MDAAGGFPVEISRLCRICLMPGLPQRYIHEKIINNDTMFSIIQNYSCIKIEDAEFYPKNICGACEAQVLEIYKLKVKLEHSKRYLEDYAKNFAKPLDLRNGSPKINSEKEANCEKNGHEENIYEEINIYEDLDNDDVMVDNKENTDTQIQHNSTEIATKKKEDPKVNNEQNNKLKEDIPIPPRRNEVDSIAAKPKEDKQESLITKEDKQMQTIRNESEVKKFKIDTAEEKSKTFFSCAICGQAFKTELDLQKHKEGTNHVIKTDLNCSLCNTEVSYKKFNEHYGGHINKFKCTTCSKRFFTQKHLDRHMVLHRMKSPGFMSDILDFCKTPQKSTVNRPFATEESLIKAAKTMVATRRESTPKNYHLNLLNSSLSAATSKKYTCKHCFKVFASKAVFKEHVIAHINLKMYSCKTCHKSFSKLSNLQMHELIHFDDMVYCCEICNKRFSSQQSLVIHKKLHVGPLYKCPMCTLYFSDKVSLSHHIALHA